MTSPPIQEANDDDPTVQEYRQHVGPADGYDRMSAMQFNLLTYLGLTENHFLLDIGCGSLRAGRLFIPYLRPGHYFGIEPVEWLLQAGVDHEVGRSQIEIKRPSFNSNSEFRLSEFQRDFDFLMAQSIFSHTSQDQIRACLAEAKKVMRPDAIFTASYCEGAQNYTGDKWTVRANYTFARMKELVDETGLSCDALDWPHTDMQKWLLITHPDFRAQLPEISGTNRILQLEAQLGDMRRQRDYLFNHPWNKLGAKLHVVKIRLDFTKRELVRLIRR